MPYTLTTFPKNSGIPLEYHFYSTDLGLLLLASQAENLVYLAFADRRVQAVKELREKFSEEKFLKKENKVHKVTLQYLRHPHTSFKKIPLAVEGTPLQRAVWRALLTIPFGKTTTYSDLAKKIKKPTAVRAVASAVAKNQLAIVIPCHRVVPKTGGSGQYRWGSKRKAALLDWEQVNK